ncbi:hypothetical protein TcG_00762 [Trypanosoma cruzi]|nr:hypothetical protein TcG_00762 [Trypanosoma cruzi]
MQPAEGTFRYRLRETRARVWRALLPDDRPTPVFTLLVVNLNGAQLIHGFDILLSMPCSASTAIWCALGVANSIVNMIYAIAVMWRMRHRIEEGIPLESSTVRLFLLEPINIAFLVYVVWEIAWMFSVSCLFMTPLVRDDCGTYLSVQLGCSFFFFVVGGIALGSTFLTELFKTPRWRHHADEVWQRKHPVRGFIPLTLTNILGDDYRTDMGTIPKDSQYRTQEEQTVEMTHGGLALSGSSGVVEVNADSNDIGEVSKRRRNTTFPVENKNNISAHMSVSCFSPREYDQNE